MARGDEPSPFGPGLFRFLRALKRNNDRDWFAAHKDRYEDEVREPALAFIRMMASRVRRISPHLRASDRRVGGSLMRIHRDVRFSKSKLPYKTNVGIQFRHEAGKDVHAPGLYVHVEPGSCFVACGMWHPDPESLRAVRRAIVDDPGRWKRVRDGKRFRETWRLGGNSLKRPPRGFDADHALIEDIKRTDHIALSELPDDAILAPGLVEDLSSRFRRAAPYLRWLAEGLGLPF